MLISLLNIIKDLYAEDAYIILMDLSVFVPYPWAHMIMWACEPMATHVATRGVRQSCPLPPLLFSLLINDIDSIAEGVEGALKQHTGHPHALFI